MLDGRVLAGVWLADELQPSAAAAVSTLLSRGYALLLLSGDRPAAVTDVAQRLGIERAEGGADPETKLRVLAELRGHGGVAMVGDGVNDAAAMAAADVGIAVRGAAEPAIEAADVYFASGGLAALPDVLRLSRRAVATIRRNVAFSLLYNVVGAMLAISGVLGPLGAAVLMPASSLTVLLSSLAVGRKSH
jgi:P-type E1-E2 ATPase